ncbi:MAG TPA: hypothetical protein VEW42_03180 [Candidatus Eisenbacteria bacterium]|nr:hypothetical protein [Candidatus Eisenbacteria bacterium]
MTAGSGGPHTEGPAVHYGSPDVKKAPQNPSAAVEKAKPVIQRLTEAVQHFGFKRKVKTAEEEGTLTIDTLLDSAQEPVYREGESIYDGPLSRKLERHNITLEKLAQNTAEYPELVRELTQEEQRQVSLIRDTLLKDVPLVHATRNRVDFQHPLIPARENDSGTKDQALDRELGLDEYVFAHWGFPSEKYYGGNFLLLDAQLLLDPYTVVTPKDISYAVSGLLLDERFSQLPREVRERVRQDYLNKMLTGERWLELMARKILFGYQEAAGKPYLFRADEVSSMGEIKFHGPLPTDNMLRVVAEWDGSLAEHYQSLYQHGFAYGPLETGDDGRTPQGIGVDYEQAARFWEKRLEPRNPTQSAS